LFKEIEEKGGVHRLLHMVVLATEETNHPKELREEKILNKIIKINHREVDFREVWIIMLAEEYLLFVLGAVKRVIKTIAPQIILHLSFSNTVLTLASAILLTDMRFLSRPGMCNTSGKVLILPSFSNNFTLPRPMIFFVESSPRKTFPLYFSYSENHSLWGVI